MPLQEPSRVKQQELANIHLKSRYIVMTYRMVYSYYHNLMIWYTGNAEDARIRVVF
jgi:hypothetical protein